MKNKSAYALAMLSSLMLAATTAHAQGASNAPPKPTIILVHGAFASALGWSSVISILQKDGYNVLAVENPLTGFTEDVATTKRVIDAQKGPVVVVGHSYGGGVITAAAAGAANVKALVYVAAFAPEANEPLGSLGEKYPTALGKALRPDAAGFLYVDPAQFRELFAADIPASQTAVLAAAQKPIASSAFGATVTTPAWKTIPSWYLVSSEDKAINPDLERFYAKRMNATTKEVKASHAAFASQPEVVAKFIEQAAKGVK